MRPSRWNTDTVVIGGTVLVLAPLALLGMWQAFVWLMWR